MGLAFLPNGSRMEYEKYLQSNTWRNVKANRLAFDNWQCVVCHKELTVAETHHLDYSRLGHENIETDVISLCKSCHQKFHNIWAKKEYWKDSGSSHWNDFSLQETARFCNEYLHEDFFFGGELNLCDDEAIFGCIDDFYRNHNFTAPVYICVTDIKLYVRNRRYDILIESNKNGEDVEDLLDRLFGKKGIKGGNPKRAKARAFLTKHTIGRIKVFYNEDPNILLLMTEASELEKNNIYKEN